MSLSEGQLLRFLLEFSLLLLMARGLGELVRRLGQPQVIGELLAGVVLGPSIIGGLAPGAYRALFPTAGVQPVLLQLAAQVGVILLLLLSGLEVDYELVRRKAKPAVLIAMGGVVVPFLGGYGLASLLPAALAGKAGPGTVFGLFLATAMSISAIPVIVKILLDMDLMRRDVGQLTLAAGVLSDATGWLLLSAVSGIATARTLPLTSLGLTLFELLAFVAFYFTLGYRLLRAFIAWVDDHVGGESAALTAVLIAGLAGAAVTQALHLEAFLGAFFIGVQLARVPRIGPDLRAKLQAMTLAVFAPVFFATAGLDVNLHSLLTVRLGALTLAVIAVACVGKFLGTYAGARLAGLRHWLSVSLGAGMNARGAVEIIVATVGLRMGILGVPMYSIVIVMAVATSMMAPPLLRWSLRRAPADPEEAARLRREAWQAHSFLRGMRRMLVPVRDGRYAMIAAEVVSHLAADRSVEAVALQVRPPAAERPSGSPAEDAVAVPAPDSLANVTWTRREASHPAGVSAAVLAEAERGYDVLVVGAGAASPGRGLFGPVADAIVRRAPCSVFVLGMPKSVLEPGWPAPGPVRSADLRLRRILLPTTGTRAARRGAEFAVALARGTGAVVVALNVLEHRPALSPFWIGVEDALRSEGESGSHATREVVHLGEAFGVRVVPEVRAGGNQTAAQEIVRYARVEACDLILMAAEARPAGQELYCGGTVSQVVRTATCPVAVLFGPAARGPWDTD